MGHFRTPKSYNLCCLEGGNQWFRGAHMFIFGNTRMGRCASLGGPHWSVVFFSDNKPQLIIEFGEFTHQKSTFATLYLRMEQGDSPWISHHEIFSRSPTWSHFQWVYSGNLPIMGCTLHHCAPPPWFRFWLNCPIACWLGWPLASSKCGTSSRWPHCNVTGVMVIGFGGREDEWPNCSDYRNFLNYST